jgi:hypothetical protein
MMIQKSIFLLLVFFNLSATFAQANNNQLESANIFSPNRIHITAAIFKRELDLQKQRLDEINRQLSYAPNSETATRLRDQANNIRFGSYNIQVRNAAAQAALGDSVAMGQLANAAQVNYAETNIGFVVVQLSTNQQWVAVTSPMSRENFVNYMYQLIFGAY